jgi:hypothetical protein
MAMRCGLLLESAQIHERSAAESIDRLQSHTRDLDALVRDEIRRTLIDELRALTAEIGESVAMLRALRRKLSVRHALWTFAVGVATAGVPGVIVWALLPSAQRVDALRAERDALQSAVRDLRAHGAAVVWSRCGPARRLCVRIDRDSPAYGALADYRIVAGE